MYIVFIESLFLTIHATTQLLHLVSNKIEFQLKL